MGLTVRSGTIVWRICDDPGELALAQSGGQRCQIRLKDLNHLPIECGVATRQICIGALHLDTGQRQAIEARTEAQKRLPRSAAQLKHTVAGLCPDAGRKQNRIHTRTVSLQGL
jgi:hypothetical protein